MASDARASTGRAGEDAALQRYLRSGYRLVTRNWRCAIGEIDLVVERRGVLVICEVKARTAGTHGAPFEAVTWEKRRRIRALAEAFLASGTVTGADDREVRFDVASVTFGNGGQPEVHVFEDAF